ncbi:MAG: hypothetical protein IJA02_04440 [Clostridia bacterium]|nr:hypothetical protein [Clostridia bacterium]
MYKIISFVMALFFSALSFFGIPFESPDLQHTTGIELVPNNDEIEYLQSVFETETAWIASLQLENGAIPMTYSQNGELTVNPYFADFAALALLDNSEKYANHVKAYLAWHFSRLNTAATDYNGIDGTIYDYTVTVENGKITKETSKQSYDSTDSYAATFLTVLNKYHEKTGDKEYLVSKANDIKRIVNAMLSTMHNGLTFAKPDYEVKYLMDNCEVFEGITAAIELFEKAICPNDTTCTDTLESLKDAQTEMKKAFDRSFWNYFGSYYKPAITKTNANALDFSWNNYYPSATAQLFPIICGVIAPDTGRAHSLYNQFCLSYEWEKLEIPDSFCWGSNAYAAALMNDIESVMCYMRTYNEKFNNHQYPLYNADSAKVAMAAKIIIDNAKVS